MRFCLLILLLFLLVVPSFVDPSSSDQNHEALIQKAEKLVKDGKYSEGIAILETLSAQDPQDAAILNRLFSAYESYSEQLTTQKRYEQAQIYLKKMDEVLSKIAELPVVEFSPQPARAPSKVKREVAETKAFLLEPILNQKVGNLISMSAGRERYNEAVEYFNKRQYGLAEDLLKESIELDSTNPYAFELLGEIANLNHDLAQANFYYKKAFSLNPDPKLREKYERLIREQGIDKGQEQYSDEHFIIRYQRSENLEGSKIREFLREAYRTLSQEFGYYPKYKIPVLLYNRSEYEQLSGTAAPHWSAGLFDGKIRLPIYQMGSSESGMLAEKQTEQNLKKLIYHELTHAFVLDLSQLECPLWLNEGLAQHQENKIQPIHLAPLVQAVQTNSLIDINGLILQDLSTEMPRDKATLFYVQSFSLVSYLLEHYRFYQMKQLLVDLGAGKTFSDTFETNFGLTFQEAAGNWQRELKARYAKN